VSARHVLVVGSGPSGVHFAETALGKGCDVTMVDVGRAAPQPVLSDSRFDELKDRLDDPVSYFLGSDFDGVVLPDREKEYYGIPPSKQYVFEDSRLFARLTDGFEPLFSYARGGLAQAWTGGCYPFNEAELGPFPFGYDRLAPHYDSIAERIGINGEADDLAAFMPVHRHLQDPLPLDAHSQLIVRRYAARRRILQERLGTVIGRTRIATITRDRAGRGACTTLGRCLWGCPRQALYTPSCTLDQIEGRAGFRYIRGVEATLFRYDATGRITTLEALDHHTRERLELPVDTLALAAGTLSTTAIVLRSVRAAGGPRLRLTGLMDNRQVLVPFLNVRMLGRAYEPGSYQYHLLGMGLTSPEAREYVHGQITTLKTALMHPIVQQVPGDLKTSLGIARVVHAALGMVNLNFHDDRRDDSWVELDEAEPERARLVIRYTPPATEAARISQALRRVTRALAYLGCVVPPGMRHVRPMGASVHYAGTLPMAGPTAGPWTSDELGRSRAFSNLLLADGATFPFLPAKNLTFTLMANASRIAAETL